MSLLPARPLPDFLFFFAILSLIVRRTDLAILDWTG
jgi:hypothetical protein